MNSKCTAALFASAILLVAQSANAVNDAELAQKVRQAFDADPSLSSVADRVKIHVENGRVTLKGSVETQEQRQSVERRATEAAGPGNITDDITITAARTKRRK